MVVNLTCAYRTELAVEKNIHLLSEVLVMYICVTLVLLNPSFANSVDPDQLASEDGN